MAMSQAAAAIITIDRENVVLIHATVERSMLPLCAGRRKPGPTYDTRWTKLTESKYRVPIRG